MQKKQENYITTAELAKMFGISRVAAQSELRNLSKRAQLLLRKKARATL